MKIVWKLGFGEFKELYVLFWFVLVDFGNLSSVVCNLFTRSFIQKWFLRAIVLHIFEIGLKGPYKLLLLLSTCFSLRLPSAFLEGFFQFYGQPLVVAVELSKGDVVFGFLVVCIENVFLEQKVVLLLVGNNWFFCTLHSSYLVLDVLILDLSFTIAVERLCSRRSGFC